MTTTATPFHERLRAARGRLGLTQTELAALSGLSWLTVSHLETGAANPRLDTMEKLAQALQVRVKDLV